jgi:hypothetical protein
MTELEAKGITGTGSFWPRGGAVVTAGGLILIGTRSDSMLMTRIPASSSGRPCFLPAPGYSCRLRDWRPRVPRTSSSICSAARSEDSQTHWSRNHRLLRSLLGRKSHEDLDFLDRFLLRSFLDDIEENRGESALGSRRRAFGIAPIAPRNFFPSRKSVLKILHVSEFKPFRTRDGSFLRSESFNFETVRQMHLRITHK